MLNKIEAIVPQVTSRIRRTTHKHGVEVPTSLNHVDDVDSMNKNTFWKDDIAKEMKSIDFAFEMLETVKVAPIGHNRTSGHVMFDVKIDFTRKAIWVLDEHRNPSPEGSVHAGASCRESARIAFTCAALNNADGWACDIQNTCKKILICATLLSSDFSVVYFLNQFWFD